MSKVSPYYKAAAGFVVGALTALLGATDGGITGQEWLTVLIAGLGGSGLVYVAPKNKPKALVTQGRPFHDPDSTDQPVA